MAALILVILCLMLGSLVTSQNCRTPMSASTLRTDLFCGYDRTIRPVKDVKTCVTIELNTKIQFLYFEEYTNEIYVETRMIWKWTDELLTWDPANYGGVKSLTVSADSIWIPDLSLYHHDLENLGRDMLGSSKCLLQNSGKIQCVPTVNFPALCRADTVRWPYESVRCQWFFATWMHFGHQINLSLIEGGIDTSHYLPNNEFLLKTAKVSFHEDIYSNGTFPYLWFYIELERHSEAHEATIISPAIVAPVLTLLTYNLPSVSAERVALGSLSVIIHCLCVTHMGYKLPPSGNTCPTILHFFEVSLILAAVSLGLSTFNKWMCTTTRPPPQWIIKFTDRLLRSYRLRQQLHRLLPEGGEVGEEVTESDNKNEEKDSEAAEKLRASHEAWNLVAKIVNIVSCLTIACVLGVLLSLVFIQKQK